MLGQKVSITSAVPQTTRTEVRAVLTRPDGQAVFVDTPGIHKARTVLGERLNRRAADAVDGVDVTIQVVDATAPVGKGDRRVAGLSVGRSIGVVNKIDVASRRQVLEQLEAVAAVLGCDEVFPVSASTGEGVETLVDGVVACLPEGSLLYPGDVVTDTPEALWVAELVREQLLAVTRDEVPHSIACRVTEWEWPHIRCEILVERESQKGIVIGHGGAVLREVGSRVRAQLPPGAFLELFVKVERDWQSRPRALEQLGY
jgi:GTP-binding protein Era